MVLLVDKNDNPIGEADKIEAHEKGLLHRAFSVFIFNSKNELLIHRRALTKYHSPGLWTNTCCSHPFPGENTEDAAHRRLKEEMGLESDLTYLFKFQYFAPFDNGLKEHEIDHVFYGKSDEIPQIDFEEVDSYKYVSLETLRNDVRENPDRYTEWFKIILQKFDEQKLMYEI